MDQSAFIDEIKGKVMKAVAEDAASTFQYPPGRKPRAELVQISNLFHSLSDEQKVIFRIAIEEIVRQSFFSIFSVIDGSTVIDNSVEKFLLVAKGPSGNQVINENESLDLHDYFAPD